MVIFCAFLLVLVTCFSISTICVVMIMATKLITMNNEWFPGENKTAQLLKPNLSK